MIDPIVLRQFDTLKSKHPLATLHEPKDESTEAIIEIKNISVNCGWNRKMIDIFFTIPRGYTVGARPRDFYCNSDMRLANGGYPIFSRERSLPLTNANHLWLSWIPKSWNCNQQELYNYLLFCKARFNHVY